MNSSWFFSISIMVDFMSIFSLLGLTKMFGFVFGPIIWTVHELIETHKQLQYERKQKRALFLLSLYEDLDPIMMCWYINEHSKPKSL
jgi:hypothetical protein